MNRSRPWRSRTRPAPFRFVLALLACLPGTGCTVGHIGDPPTVRDPAFAGTWAASDLELRIEHRDGLLYIVGFDMRAGSPWISTAMTGEVTGPGRARASGELWRAGAGGAPVLLGSVEADLFRFNDTLDLTLDYVAAGAERRETVTLVRQQP